MPCLSFHHQLSVALRTSDRRMGLEVKFHAFLILALDGVERSALRSVRYFLAGKPRASIFMEVGMGRRVGVGAVVQRKASCSRK
jgi:hypothetical protein